MTKKSLDLSKKLQIDTWQFLDYYPSNQQKTISNNKNFKTFIKRMKMGSMTMIAGGGEDCVKTFYN